MKRAAWVGVVIGVSVAPWLLAACVGGDDSGGPKPGALGGACLTNGTCNTGLVCTIVGSSALCEAPDADADVDATADAPADQTTQDGAKDAGPDAPYDCGATLDIPISTCSVGYTDCYNAADAGGRTCFLDDVTCSGYWPNDVSAHCFQECDGGISCCGSNVAVSYATCPATLTLTANSAVLSCKQTCGTGEVKLCANNGECGTSGKCTPAFFKTVPGLSTSVLGICE